MLTWQEIMNQVVEINELLQQILVKSNNMIIKEITDRYSKYGNGLSLELRTLNNAVLEHQITITPYQIIILEKVNNLSLDTDMKKIYANIPTNQEEATKYVMGLKEKYNLANNCLDLVMNIERLTQIEYVPSEAFEKSEYAKKFNFEEEMFSEYIKSDKTKEQLENFKNDIIIKQKEYIEKLPLDKKKDLLIQTLTLSYDRNAFVFINEASTIIKICNQNNYNELGSLAISSLHDKYKKLFNIIEMLRLTKMPLQEIYDEFNLIYETEFFKQKINKK